MIAPTDSAIAKVSVSKLNEIQFYPCPFITFCSLPPRRVSAHASNPVIKWEAHMGIVRNDNGHALLLSAATLHIYSALWHTEHLATMRPFSATTTLNISQTCGVLDTDYKALCACILFRQHQTFVGRYRIRIFTSTQPAYCHHQRRLLSLNLYYTMFPRIDDLQQQKRRCSSPFVVIESKCPIDAPRIAALGSQLKDFIQETVVTTVHVCHTLVISLIAQNDSHEHQRRR